eukprot:13139348-Alexandrium_andersonii.AAC.1
MPGGCTGRPQGRHPARPTARRGQSRLRRSAPWSQRAARRHRQAGSTAPASARRRRPSRRPRHVKTGAPPGR